MELVPTSQRTLRAAIRNDKLDKRYNHGAFRHDPSRARS